MVALATMLLCTLILLSLYALLIGYYGYYWNRATSFKAAPSVPPTTVSVIIAARNEVHTLPALIRALEGQTYPREQFEIIIVNDHSTDGTEKLADQLPAGFQMILPDTLSEHSSKKKALARGVQQAKGELIIVTDADCLVPPEWLSVMACYQQNTGAQFIAAPVKFTYGSSLLQVFQALDFMVLQGITAASVSARFHSMANGANLAYTKKAYTDVNGFEGIDTVASGDDMLLMYKIWQQDPQHVHYLKSREAIVTTDPMQTWSAFINQRRRWASKTFYYDDKKVIAVAALVYSINLWAIVLSAVALINLSYSWLLVGYLLAKTVIELPFVYSISQFYKEGKLLWYFPLFQPLHILYTVSVGFLSQLGSYEWKGRRTR